jgi:hypothetical protein
MAGERKAVPFKVVEEGKPLILEVKRRGKTLRLKVATRVTEIFDLDQINPFNNEPIFEIRMVMANEIQTKKKGRGR